MKYKKCWLCALFFVGILGFSNEEDALCDKLTIITTTSPIPSNPDTRMLEETQKSLYKVPALRGCKKIIVFDGVPPRLNYCKMAYEQYIHNVDKLTKEHPHFANTILVINREWKHLAWSLREAMKHVDTPYVFVHQHDFSISRVPDVINLIASMDDNPNLKHVRLNRLRNLTNGWDGPVDDQIEGPCYVPLTRTFGWSDNDHFARVDYYWDFVFPKITRLGAMEWFLHNPEKIKANHNSYGTYIYGAPGESPYLQHLNGRAYK